MSEATRETDEDYDVAILGGGLAGCALAAILARQGQRVVVIEAREHPRFAIGESMILETSEVLRALAQLYDVPELAWFSSESFLPETGCSHGVKRHFSFMLHQIDEEHEPARTLQAVIPEHPHGHELHLFRQDSDQRMLIAAIRHGAIVRQGDAVDGVGFDDAGATVRLRGGAEIRAAYVVDASGFASPLARQFELRHQNLRTRSRALFTHVIGVPGVEAVSPKSVPTDLPFALEEGTLHHLFDGGWLWVIPFDNHPRAVNPLCSIGLLLDPEIHPLRAGLPPEQEVAELIARFPTIERQLGHLKPVRAWTRSPRIQFSSRAVVGDRFCLLGHAAGFVDPLFSKGLYTSMAAVATAADLLLTARRSGDFSRQAFLPLEHQTLSFISGNDQLAATAYASFRHPALWRVTSVLWLAGAYTELLKLLDLRARAAGDPTAYRRGLEQLSLVGGGFAGFCQLSDRCAELIQGARPGDEQAVADQVAALMRAESWLPQPFRAVLDGATHLPRRKLRFDIVGPRGALNVGAFRVHFFGHRGWIALALTALKDALDYGRWPRALRRIWRRRRPAVLLENPGLLPR